MLCLCLTRSLTQSPHSLFGVSGLRDEIWPSSPCSCHFLLLHNKEWIEVRTDTWTHGWAGPTCSHIFRYHCSHLHSVIQLVLDVLLRVRVKSWPFFIVDLVVPPTLHTNAFLSTQGSSPDVVVILALCCVLNGRQK